MPTATTTGTVPGDVADGCVSEAHVCGSRSYVAFVRSLASGDVESALIFLRSLDKNTPADAARARRLLNAAVEVAIH